MSKTVPSPNIDIGIRPMIAAVEKRQPPGISKISAYGRSGRVSRPAGDRLAGSLASSIPVIGRIAPCHHDIGHRQPDFLAASGAGIDSYASAFTAHGAR